MSDQAKAPPKGKLAIVAACAVCVSVTASFEGLRTRPYRDVTGTPTVCYGDTAVPMRNYSAQECADLLRQRQMADYAPAVLKCVPGFSDPRRKNAFAASVDFAYNVGVSAFCRSTIAKRFNVGQWQDGCNHFLDWTKANGKVLPGLVRRREAEKSLCLRAVA